MSVKKPEGEQRTSPVAGAYVLVRSRRRTIGMEVRPDATLVVRAPARTPVWYVESLLREKAGWIEDKLEKARSQVSLPPRHDFLTGERFPYLGREWPFVVLAFQKTPLTFDEKAGFSLDMTAFDRGEVAFEEWYRARAHGLLAERVQHYAPLVGVSVPRLRITGAERRWGSCSTSGTVSFAWRLVMAPMDVVDYVVVHELAHRREMNHSTKFWAVVASVLPDYDVRRRWLRDHGGMLTI
ncbi:MAG: SprT family zinc-dependent metalloprotease [Caldiserica bacterium]|nr:SprT family zinc-dependent metalloprotease [Caldisericota bacterium]